MWCNTRPLYYHEIQFQGSQWDRSPTGEDLWSPIHHTSPDKKESPKEYQGISHLMDFSFLTIPFDNYNVFGFIAHIDVFIPWQSWEVLREFEQVGMKSPNILLNNNCFLSFVASYRMSSSCEAYPTVHWLVQSIPESSLIWLATTEIGTDLVSTYQVVSIQLHIITFT